MKLAEVFSDVRHALLTVCFMRETRTQGNPSCPHRCRCGKGSRSHIVHTVGLEASWRHLSRSLMRGPSLPRSLANDRPLEFGWCNAVGLPEKAREVAVAGETEFHGHRGQVF